MRKIRRLPRGSTFTVRETRVTYRALAVKWADGVPVAVRLPGRTWVHLMDGRLDIPRRRCQR